MGRALSPDIVGRRGRGISSGKRKGRSSGEGGETHCMHFLAEDVRLFLLTPCLDFEHFHKSSALVQIISLYLTVLFPWLSEGKVNQSLTAQNLTRACNKDVPQGGGQAWGASQVYCRSRLPPGHIATCRSYKIAQLHSGICEQPQAVSLQMERL